MNSSQSSSRFSPCALWINVARTDVSFVMHTIPHLVKMCDYPFTERVLAVDTAPLSGDKAGRPNVGSMDDLRNCCKRLLERGVVDKVIDIDYSESTRKILYRKHFGTGRIKATHDWVGYPVFGMIYCIENAQTDYFLHFDSDMLFFQEKKFNWVEKGIEILKQNPDIFYVRPQSGPQSHIANLYEKEYMVTEFFSEFDLKPVA